jgi:rare lipoprotein A
MEHSPANPVGCLAVALLANLLAVGAVSAQSVPRQQKWLENVPAHTARVASVRLSPKAPLKIDRTGRPRIGIASYYADFFAGRKMANGGRMNPRGINAASRTLPLGTVAKVTNLTTHRSAIVRIEDRGPYVQGRIVDLSPSVAHRIGITRHVGIAKVRVTPLRVPLPDGSIRIASVAGTPTALPGTELR